VLVDVDEAEELADELADDEVDDEVDADEYDLCAELPEELSASLLQPVRAAAASKIAAIHFFPFILTPHYIFYNITRILSTFQPIEKGDKADFVREAGILNPFFSQLFQGKTLLSAQLCELSAKQTMSAGGADASSEKSRWDSSNGFPRILSTFFHFFASTVTKPSAFAEEMSAPTIIPSITIRFAQIGTPVSAPSKLLIE